MIKITKEWDEMLKEEFSSPEYLKLREFLKIEYSTHTVYPPMYDIFNSMKYTAFEDIKVVLLGQDPYHTFGQADGLAFSCHNGTPQPSLRNIFKEINDDLGLNMSSSTDLTPWAKQGVVLLNTSLTVVEHKPASHSNEKWHTFTKEVVKIINELNQPVVFLLWGNHAKSFLPLLDNPNHLVLTSAHPSPFSAYNGFFGCKHFSKCNNFLMSHHLTPIDWKI